ncbi:hypothetical protein PHYBLDRAFT_162346 [Phycomyces blakesleeanus NRRL 1555(-)]|uniref:Uncharacterized protein n=1 Tax=Phycomyces blakesleeanus (strain ATCC 8743b / DSM 1359 / FGSC 10004 / NBRC 33097 / NRRL 1555) TaxID=763407 RepID=A0A167Q8J3_PHYB8|nr:hypothetical protein PHYBLDRAFT_162346 [Phycomyces blakesleeanus NRRL 1555(-)]OAD79269.1 hypothetical protein PHYBLDRAFT_162346 [Phycomyces blakesleeanus NRRL 1555(-)]|eukprot:XP_018297309.1 hypothetical protein PHYBLDRAFT_162346 [Phycomyces blakesleeanus NRRL 1555(-)]
MHNTCNEQAIMANTAEAYEIVKLYDSVFGSLFFLSSSKLYPTLLKGSPPTTLFSSSSSSFSNGTKCGSFFGYYYFLFRVIQNININSKSNDSYVAAILILKVASFVGFFWITKPNTRMSVIQNKPCYECPAEFIDVADLFFSYFGQISKLLNSQLFSC